MSLDASALAWDKMDGLLPAVVQDADTLQVLMLGYMNREALDATLQSHRVTFYSRSKQRLWVKGETSGNFLALRDVIPDCDGDALVVRAIPAGPACHRNATSCFGDESAPGVGFLSRLARVVAQRHRDMPQSSYTTTLFTAGIDRIAQKVGEEGVEVVIAAKNGPTQPLKEEVSDLLFHLLVLLESRGLSLGDVLEELRGRHVYVAGAL